MQNTAAQTVPHEPSASPRMALFDIVRGFSVISMVLFHLCYDIRYIYGAGCLWFKPPLQDVWRASISWTFLFVAGCMCSFSRNNLKRSVRYLAASAAVFVVTTLVAVDTPISFGIIFCMGASTLIVALLDHFKCAPRGWWAVVLFVLAFLLLRGVPQGSVGLASFQVTLPQSLYATPYWSFLGFPGPGFASGDYYPLIPFSLMYLAGVAAGRTWMQEGFPAWFSTVSCKPLQFVGRHALPVYLFHQPLLIGICELLFT